MTENPASPAPDEARVIPLGQPIEGGDSLFEGTAQEARDYVVAMAAADRSHVAIWTPGHVFSAREFLDEVPGHEHDALPEVGDVDGEQPPRP